MNPATPYFLSCLFLMLMFIIHPFTVFYKEKLKKKMIKGKIPFEHGIFPFGEEKI